MKSYYLLWKILMKQRVSPDLSIKDATIDFLDRIFWANWWYRPDEWVSRLLSDPTGWFYHPRFHEWIVPELIKGQEYVTIATEADIETIPAGTRVIFSDILNTTMWWEASLDQETIAVCSGSINGSNRTLHIFACNLQKA